MHNDQGGIVDLNYLLLARGLECLSVESNSREIILVGGIIMRSQSHVTSAQSLLKGKIQNWEVLIEKLTRVKVVGNRWVTHLPCISLSTVCFQISPQCTFLIGDRDEIDEKSSINLLDSEIGEVLSATHREATVVGHSFALLFPLHCVFSN